MYIRAKILKANESWTDYKNARTKFNQNKFKYINEKISNAND